MRGNRLVLAWYGFGDASGQGFGSTWETREGISFRYGVWGKDSNGKSSNYRELQNIVDTAEEMGTKGDLKGVEFFLFTDNSTAKKAYYKGSSTSPTLHELVSRLRRLQMNFGCLLHLWHIAGTRMIAQGADGLSRGNLQEGVMSGKLMNSFVPLHLSPLERCNKLVGWIRKWAEVKGLDKRRLKILDVEGWFTRGQDMLKEGKANEDGMVLATYQPGLFLWHTAPAGALVALEQLRKARTKRTESVHIFICPKIMEPEWKTQVLKSADLHFEIPAGQPYWPADMHEPLILALYFPYLSHRPWELRKAPAIVAVGKHLQKLWKTSQESQGAVLRKLRGQTTRIRSLPAKLVLNMLRSPNKFEVPYR